MDIRVTEEQLAALSETIPPAMFREIGYELGFTFADVDGIQRRNLYDHRNFFMELLMTWKDRTGGSPSELRAVLRSLGLHAHASQIDPGAESGASSSSMMFPSSRLPRSDSVEISSGKPVPSQTGAESGASSSSMMYPSSGLPRSDLGEISSGKPVPSQTGGASYTTDTDGYEIIRLEEYKIEVKVPPNEKWGAKDIKVQALTEVPPELMELLKKDEAVAISFGIKMAPSDAKFSTPVEVTMPHSAIFEVLPTDPSSFAMYYRGKGADSFTLIPITPDDRPCVVRKKDLTFYVDHFCEWWIAAFLKRTLWGTRPVILTPYLPKRIERGNSQQVLYLCIRDGGQTNDVELEGHYAKLPSRSYPINMKSGDLKIRCRASRNEVDQAQNLPVTRFHHLFNAEVHFIFHTESVSQETQEIPIEFVLRQERDDSDCLKILCHFKDRV